jgi:hypothetical protein
MSMQRIARPLALAALSVSIAVSGCTTPTPQRRKPLPPPPVVTRRPQPLPPPVWRPPPPAPRPQPQPAPPPVEAPSVALDAASLRPPGGIRRGLWKVIVVHHSEKANATPQGMDSYHRQRGWENGLGYHFVIGNGVNYPDGKIFVGPRWKKQQTGAHCKAGAGTYFGVRRAGNFFNENGIGICLIGNFDTSRPTAKQQAALKKLILHLCRETGINPRRVYGHGEVTHATACPGRNLSLAGLRSTLAAAQAGAPPFAQDARVFMSGVEMEPLELALFPGDSEDAPPADEHGHGAFAGAHLLAEGVDVVHGLVADALDYIADAQADALGRAAGRHVDHHHAASGAVGSAAGVGDPRAAPENCAARPADGAGDAPRLDLQ